MICWATCFSMIFEITGIIDIGLQYVLSIWLQINMLQLSCMLESVKSILRCFLGWLVYCPKSKIFSTLWICTYIGCYCREPLLSPCVNLLCCMSSAVSLTLPACRLILTYLQQSTFENIVAKEEPFPTCRCILRHLHQTIWKLFGQIWNCSW